MNINWSKSQHLVCQLLLLLMLAFVAHLARATKYGFLIEDDEIFSSCQNKPDNVKNLKGLFDMSDLTMAMTDDIVRVSGNMTAVWDIQPKDRIYGAVQVYHFERGEWQPTVFSMTNNDFCKIMYSEHQYWHKHWTQFVINEDKPCLNKRGVTFYHEPYDLDMVFDVTGWVPSGRYKMEISFEARDEFNQTRPTSICVAIIGECVKV